MTLMRFKNKRGSTDTSSLWESYICRRDQSSRESLILSYVHLVKYVAGRVAIGLPNHIEIDDIFGAGLLGLIQAIEKFDPGRNIKFETYAIPRIRGAMLDELRTQDWFPRSIRHKAKLLEKVLDDLEMKLGRSANDREIANYMNISMEELYSLLDDVSLTSLISLDQGISSNEEGLYSIVGESIPRAEAVDPYGNLETREMLGIIKKTLSGMPEKERLVIALYYYEELTLKEIGKVLDVSESRVCQIHTKAILRLKGRINQYIRGMPVKGIKSGG